MKLLLLSGAFHLEKSLEKSLEVIKIERKFFPDNEQYIRIPYKQDDEYIIVQSMFGNPDIKIVETIFAIRTLKDLGTKKVYGFFPYLAYTRQDKRYKEGEAISQLIVLEMLNKAGLNYLITLDAHFHQGIPTIGDLKIKNITCAPYFYKFFEYANSREDFVIIGPDDYAYYLALKLSEKLSLKAGYIEKIRKGEREVETFGISIDVKNKNVILIDDMISTGGTIMKAYELLKKEGARDIFVVATHGLFVEDALKKLRNLGIKEITTTNSIPNETAVFDVSEILFEEIKWLKN